MPAAGGQKKDAAGTDHVFFPHGPHAGSHCHLPFLDCCTSSPGPVLPIEVRVIFKNPNVTMSIPCKKQVDGLGTAPSCWQLWL